MSDTPTERVMIHNPLQVYVETAPRSGVMLPNPRVGIESLVLGSDERPSTATIRIAVGPIDSSTLPQEEALLVGDVLDGVAVSGAHKLLGPDQRIWVVRQSPAATAEDGLDTPPEPPVLFQGFCQRLTYTEQSSAQGTERWITGRVDGLLERLETAAQAIIVGARMRTAAAAATAAAGSPATTPSGSPADTRIVAGVPCVFNPKGRGNCHRRPISVDISLYGTVAVPVMCDPNDPDAIDWTWANVMRYLVFWHLFEKQSGATWDDLGMIVDGKASLSAALNQTGYQMPGGVFEKTDTVYGLYPLYQLSASSRPSAPATRANAFAFAALGTPNDWPAEGLNFRDAFTALAEAAGLHYCTRTETLASGDVRERLYVWARGSGAIKDLHREVTFADSGEDAEELLKRSNVNRMNIEADYSDVTPNAIVLGAVRKYEITTELVPGWTPDAHLDNITSGNWETERDYAEAHLDIDDEALLAADAWYQRYHRKGASFGAYAHVGRKWICNFGGFYSADTYQRTVGPFTAARYAPWEPSRPYGPGATAGEAALNVGLADLVWKDGSLEYRNIEAGAWARINRRFLPCFAADADGRSLGMLIEISLNGGTTWSRLTSTTRALADEGAIVIDEEDLTKITVVDSDDGETNFWYAMITGQARVRITAVIAGDERILPNVDSGPYKASVTEMCARLFDVGDRYLANDPDAGNSIYSTGGSRAVTTHTPETRFDMLDLQAYAEQLLQVLTGRQIAGNPIIPWLETTWSKDAGYRVGDCLREIRGLGIRFRPGAESSPRSYVDIVGIIYTDRDTTLLLDDARFAEAVMPAGTTG